MADSIANRDAAFECLDIARAALKASDVARAEKFAHKALKLYRCKQTEAMMVQVQIAASELGGAPSSSGRQQHHANGHAPGAHHQQHGGRQQQQQHQQQHRQHHQQQHQPGGGAGHRSHQQQQQQQQQQQPRGMGGEGLRQRGAAGRQQQQREEPPPLEDPSVTPEQRAVVRQILAASSFYDVLGVARSASDGEIKLAYRKLALRLHPDKNKAHKADEAFKLLSKAFSCLSDADKRAYYDRTGYENTAAAQAAAAASSAAARRGGGGGFGGGGPTFYYSGPDDFDPEEIFNMFFGGGAFNAHTRVFRQQQVYRRQQQGAARPASREEQQRGALLGLMQLLPVLLIVGVTLLSSHSEPAFALARDAKYGHGLATVRMGVDFWVRDAAQFERDYPANTHKRLLLERQVESDVYERVYARCQNERMAQHRQYTWGNRATARSMELPSCAELARLNDRVGQHNSQQRQATVGSWARA